MQAAVQTRYGPPDVVRIDEVDKPTIGDAEVLVQVHASRRPDASRGPRGATLRRTLVNVPARLAQPQRRTVLHLPEHSPWAKPWLTLWDRVVGDGLPPPIAA